MHYVYILQTVQMPFRIYIGVTSDLRPRVKAHNAGQSPHTAKHRPWKLKSYVAFEELNRASAFERYIKSGSGRAFLHKRLL